MACNTLTTVSVQGTTNEIDVNFSGGVYTVGFSSTLDTELAEHALIARVPRAKALRTSVQAIGATTATAISWTTEEYDTDTIHSTVSNQSRMTIPSGMGGVWDIGYAIAWAAGTVGARQSFVTVNGGTSRWAESYVEIATAGRQGGYASIPVSAGDYLEVVVYGSVALNWGGSSLSEDYFQATYRGPGA